MSMNQLISILAIGVPSATALLVAHWHRKQARQLEAFRRDSSVGLVPPPSALWVHFRRHWDLWLYLLSIGVQVVNLVSVLRGSQPITRGTIVIISVIVSAILWNLILISIHFVQRAQNGIISMIATLVETDKTLVETDKTLAETDKVMLQLVTMTDELATLKVQVAALRQSAGDAK